MGNPQLLEVAMDFIKRINSGDVNALCELMTEGHIFQDALGKRIIGRETMRQGWTMYFKLWPTTRCTRWSFSRPEIAWRSLARPAVDIPAAAKPITISGKCLRRG
jgi:hypothetical protein